MPQVIYAHMPLGTVGVSKSCPRPQTASYITFNGRQNNSVGSITNIQARLKSVSLRFERVKVHHRLRHPSAFTTGASNGMHRGLPRRVFSSGPRTNGTIDINTSVANSSKLFRVSGPPAMRNQTPPNGSDSGLGSPLSSPTSSNNSFKYSLHTHFSVNVKWATYPHLPREIELWERTLGFLAEYLDLLVFFKASGNLRGNAEDIERSFHPYRFATANRILQALISLRDEVVEFPPSQSAVTELEMAYKAWDRLDNSLFVIIWEFNKGSRSP